MKLHYADVFVPGGLPKHTYNPRAEKHLETQLKEVRTPLHKLAIVTGHTKSGKTVLVRTMLPKDQAVWVDCGGIGDSKEDFWNEINQQLSAYTSATHSDSHESTTGGKASLKGAFLPSMFGGVEGKVTYGHEQSRRREDEYTLDTSPRNAALRALGRHLKPLVIDDFHFLPRDFQREVVRALKGLIFDGLPVVVIAIPHKQYDAVRVEKEMAGRFHLIKVPEWTIEELEFIPHRGFDILGLSIDDRWIRQIAENSMCSPHLVQEILRGLCRRFATPEGELPPSLPISPKLLDDVYKSVANTIGQPIYEKMAEGPPARTDRIDRNLVSGEVVDIYGLVLRAIASLRPGLTTLSYDDIRTAIRSVSRDVDVPAKHEITRVLRKMSTIASSEQSSAAVIEFDVDDKLHVIDPFFAFFLRFGDVRL